MSDKYAYRASEEFSVALREYQEAHQKFMRDVVEPWDTGNIAAQSLWIRQFGVDVVCVGFRNPKNEVPDGLSRSRGRRALIPKRGRAGDFWRKKFAELDQNPKVSRVFARFRIDPTIIRIDMSRIYTPGLFDAGDAVYLTWGVEHPEPGEHLTPVLLSEYYAAREREALHDAQ